MTTSEYVSWLIKRVGGNKFSRQDLIDAINQAQNEILGRDILYMRVKPDPYFVTTAATYSYVASSAILDSLDGSTTYDIRNVSRIYAPSFSHSRFSDYGGPNRSTMRPENTVNANPGEIHIPSDCEQSINPDSLDCTVKLHRENDPGTQATLYLAECYKWPTQVLSEGTALSIPVQFQRGLLKYAVLKDLEYTEFGSADRPEDLYAKELKKFDAWASRGATTRPTGTPPREC